jgi:hypothetical protein
MGYGVDEGERDVSGVCPFEQSALPFGLFTSQKDRFEQNSDRPLRYAFFTMRYDWMYSFQEYSEFR